MIPIDRTQRRHFALRVDRQPFRVRTQKPRDIAWEVGFIIFEQAGCAWCETFDREIAPIYPKTAEGRRAPLRRVNIDHPVPSDLAFVEVERLAPVFVLVHNGKEIGRIRGYPGEDHFWGLLGALMKKLDAVTTGGEPVSPVEKTLRPVG